MEWSPGRLLNWGASIGVGTETVVNYLLTNRPHPEMGYRACLGLLKLARKYGFAVISDFAYADVAFDGYKAPSFLASPGAADVGVEFTTMSKGYNMAGWRVGFCAGNRQMIKALATIKGYYDYGMFQAVQIAAIMALRQGDAGMENQAAIYQSRRDALCESLHRIGWPVTPPKASMFCWVPIPEPWRSRMSTMDFGMMLLEKGNTRRKRSSAASGCAAYSALPARGGTAVFASAERIERRRFISQRANDAGIGESFFAI